MSPPRGGRWPGPAGRRSARRVAVRRPGGLPLAAVLLLIAGTGAGAAAAPALTAGGAPFRSDPRAGDSAGAPFVISTTAVVRFRPGVPRGEQRPILGLHRLAEVDAMPGTDLVLVRPAQVAAVASREVTSDPAVAGAWPEATLRSAGRFVNPGLPATAASPGDPLFRYQWNLPLVGVPSAWNVSTGAGATVAVLDTGVAYEDRATFRRAPELAATHFVGGWDFVDGGAHPDDAAPRGRPSHGTHIAGIIADAAGNGIGGAGLAPQVAIMPLRVLAADGTGSSWAVARGLRFATDHGAEVANLSLGGESGSPELADAVEYAVRRGVTVVASAGDTGAASLGYPAAYPGVLAVGSVRVDLTRPAYSSHGPGLALVAPGGDVTVDQNGDGIDDGVEAQTLFGGADAFCFCFLEGTSAAAAHVSAAAALLVASGRARSPARVRAALIAGARPLGARDEYGAGLVQIPAALAWAAAAGPDAARFPPGDAAAGGQSPPAAPGAVTSPVPQPGRPPAALVPELAAVTATAAALLLGPRRRRRERARGRRCAALSGRPPPPH